MQVSHVAMTPVHDYERHRHNKSRCIYLHFYRLFPLCCARYKNRYSSRFAPRCLMHVLRAHYDFDSFDYHHSEICISLLNASIIRLSIEVDKWTAVMYLLLLLLYTQNRSFRSSTSDTHTTNEMESGTRQHSQVSTMWVLPIYSLAVCVPVCMGRTIIDTHVHRTSCTVDRIYSKQLATGNNKNRSSSTISCAVLNSVSHSVHRRQQQLPRRRRRRQQHISSLNESTWLNKMWRERRETEGDRDTK